MCHRYCKPRLNAASFAALTILTANGISPAHGQEPPNVIDLTAGYGYSDNVARQVDDGVSSGMTIVGLNADWISERPLYSVSLDSDLDYIFYSDDRLRDRPDGRLNVALTAHLLPDRVDWSVFNEFTQVREDINLGNSPDNLRRYNILGTTLDIQLPLGQRTALGASGTFERRKSETGLDLDSDSVTGALTISRQISRTRALSFIVDASNIRYDDLLSTEYDIQRAYLRYQSSLASGQVELDVGANRLDDASLATELDTTPLFRLTWQRDLTSRSRLSLSGVYQWSDLGSSAALGGNPGDENSGILNPTSSPFKERRATIDLTTNLTATSFRLALSASDQEYENPFVQDFLVYSASLQLTRELSSGISLILGGSFNDRQSEDPIDDSEDIFANPGIRKSLGRRFSAQLSYQYRNRDAQNGSDFEENQLRIDLIARLQN